MPTQIRADVAQATEPATSSARWAEHGADRLIVVNATNGFGQQGGHRDDFDGIESLFGRERNGIGHAQRLDRCLANAIDGVVAQHAVSGGQVDFLGTVLMDQLGSTANRACRC